MSLSLFKKDGSSWDALLRVLSTVAKLYS